MCACNSCVGTIFQIAPGENFGAHAREVLPRRYPVWFHWGMCLVREEVTRRCTPKVAPEKRKGQVVEGSQEEGQHGQSMGARQQLDQQVTVHHRGMAVLRKSRGIRSKCNRRMRWLSGRVN